MTSPTPKLDYACPSECSLRPEAIGPGAAAALLVIKGSGVGIRTFAKRASEILGHPVPTSNVQRHFKHFRELNAEEEAHEEKVEAGEKFTDLEILDRIISAGARNAKNWKPTIGDTLKAMEMKLRLTGNSAFEDMLNAMALASAGDEEIEDDEVVEAPEAILSEEERDGGDSD